MKYSALIGKNTEHSKSHKIFSILEKDYKIEHSHIKINVEEQNLEQSINELKDLGFCFINVTFPYKIKCIKFLDELSDDCKIMKSVNTIKFIGNKKIGYNVDGISAIAAIQLKLKKINSKDKVLIFGAGGVARSIIYELLKYTKNITVINIDLFENGELADIFNNIQIYDFSCDFVEKINSSNIIINATSVGNDSQDCVVSSDDWTNISDLHNKYFFDVILTPTETTFLKNAKKRHAKTCSGLYMTIIQLVALFLEFHNLSKINDENYIEKIYSELK